MVQTAVSRIQYAAAGRRLTASGTFGYATSSPLTRISVLGVLPAPTQVTVNGVSVPFEYTGQTLTLSGLTLSMSAPFNVAW